MKKFIKKAKSCAYLVLFASIVGGLLLCPSLKSFAAKGDLVSVVQDDKNAIILEYGKARVLTVDGDISDVLIASPGIVDVMAVQSNQLYLVGANYGDTNLLILDNLGNVLEDLNIHVRLDLQVLEEYLADKFPDESISLDMLSDQLILGGSVSTPEVASQIKRIAGIYYMEIIEESGEIDEWVVDLMQVQGERQVMLRVRIVEVTRSILKELGTNRLTVADYGGLLGKNIGSRSGVDGIIRSTAAGDSGGVQEPGFGTLEVFSSLGAFGPIDIVFEALIDDGLANLLAEPNLTAISGSAAGFLAGGEFPVPSGRDSDGNVIITFRDFGVSLNFIPTVMTNDRIVLQLNTEVSSLNRAESVTLAGLEIPGLDIRRAETTVEIGSGQSLMIAGLLQSEAVQSLANIPGIDKTPILGDLLESESFQRSETELVVVVSPFVVRPYANKINAKNNAVRAANALAPVRVAPPLMEAFAATIRRTYGKSAELALSDMSDYGYILD